MFWQAVLASSPRDVRNNSRLSSSMVAARQLEPSQRKMPYLGEEQDVVVVHDVQHLLHAVVALQRGALCACATSSRSRQAVKRTGHPQALAKRAGVSLAAVLQAAA